MYYEAALIHNIHITNAHTETKDLHYYMEGKENERLNVVRPDYIHTIHIHTI